MSDTNHGLRLCAVAVAVALALGLSGCGGGANVKPSQPPATGTGDFTGGNIDVGSGDTLVWPNNINGSIDLIKGSAGTLVLTGTDGYTGGTTINDGTLQIGNGGTTGSIVGNVVDNAFLVFDRSDNVTFNGFVSGTGSLRQAGAGTLTLTGVNIYTGGTTISSGTLQIGDGGTTGSIRGDVNDNGTLAFDHADNVIFTGTVTGSGGLTQTGNGSLYLSGTNGYTGVTQVIAGSLYVDGDQSAATGATNVANGATLGGTGTLGGDVNVGDGATLMPGLGDIGTLTINGSLNLSAGSTLDYNFRPTGPLGSQLSALINVKGNLTLDGTLNVNVEQGGDLGPGVHRLFNYDGTLVDNGLTLGNMPSSGWVVQTGVAQQVNLVDTKGMTFSFWDGDVGPKGNDAINGGNGTWENGSSLPNNNWTDASGAVNASFSDGSFAVFQDTPGMVVVNDGNGAVNAAGMQLASNGYIIQGDAIHLVGSADDPTQSIIRVGDGTTAGASYTATINSVLDGDSALVKTDAGTLALGGANTYTGGTTISGGTLQIGNGGTTGSITGNVTDNASLAFNRSDDVVFNAIVSGTGSLTQNGTGKLTLTGANTYSGGTTINKGSLLTSAILPGDAIVNAAGVLDSFANFQPMPGVANNLTNAGKVAVHNGDSTVGGNYVQSSTGTLAISLGSKLAVTGPAALAGTLEITGADNGYVSNSHTNVLTATGGVSGTFGQLVKDTGVVFTATTINYDANSVWLDTTGLNITTAAAGNGVAYTPASFGSAQRVQGAFNQLDSKIAAGNLSGVSSGFVQAAGQFQQAPTLQAAQASLQSLSGQLHAASAAMTFEAIDASSRALSDHFDSLLDKGIGYGMWTHNLSVGGDMARSGFNSVGFQLNGWLVGNDRQIGRSGVAGYAFGQSRGQQRLDQSYDHDTSRTTEGMFYAGWLNGNWYTQGRVGFGHIQQDVNRQILLGQSAQGVGTQYNGNYSVAYDEAGLHFGNGNSHITPFVDVQYARINRDGFAEQGAGGFGLQSNSQTTDRWQAGLGLRANRHWDFGDGRGVDFSARAQWQRSLAEHGEVFDASFVGLQQWQPLVGVGLSRYSGLFGLDMNATLSKHTTLKFSYDYEAGQHDNAQTLMTQLNVAF